MNYCITLELFAYFGLLYFLTSIFYLIITFNYGTPFKNALNSYPELKSIKANSVYKRKNAFYIGFILSSIILYITKPFNKCTFK